MASAGFEHPQVPHVQLPEGVLFTLIPAALQSNAFTGGAGGGAERTAAGAGVGAETLSEAQTVHLEVAVPGFEQAHTEHVHVPGAAT